MNENMKNFELNEDDLTAVAGGVSDGDIKWIWGQLIEQKTACPSCGKEFTSGNEDEEIEVHAYEKETKALVTVRCRGCGYKFMKYIAT